MSAGVLEELPLVDPRGIFVRVRQGVVNLSGPVESSSLRQQDLIAVVLRLVWDVDGVVDVVNRLGGATEGGRPGHLTPS